VRGPVQAKLRPGFLQKVFAQLLVPVSCGYGTLKRRKQEDSTESPPLIICRLDRFGSLDVFLNKAGVR